MKDIGKKMKPIKHTKQWEAGYWEGIKDGKAAVKQSREEKRLERKDKIRREVIRELRGQFKDIFGFITDNDLEERMDRHLSDPDGSIGHTDCPCFEKDEKK